jgi:hypothetical protein
MEKIKILLLLLLVLISAPMEAHQDYLERPLRYSFILTNGQVVHFEDAEDPRFLAFEQSVLLGKLTLAQAEVAFAGNRTMLVRFTAGACSEISISSEIGIMKVPLEVAQRMEHIHFSTIVWLSSSKKLAAAGKDFYLQFSLGRETTFGKYPYLQLHFKKRKFENAYVWRQIAAQSKQRSAF